MTALIATPERRISGSPNDRRISPAVGEWAILECARLRELNKQLLAAVEAAYTVLGATSHEWKGRNTTGGQFLLLTLRDAISDATGREHEDVQDDYCNRAARNAIARAAEGGKS